jgi:hypothetical protein
MQVHTCALISVSSAIRAWASAVSSRRRHSLTRKDVSASASNVFLSESSTSSAADLTKKFMSSGFEIYLHSCRND